MALRHPVGGCICHKILAERGQRNGWVLIGRFKAGIVAIYCCFE